MTLTRSNIWHEQLLPYLSKMVFVVKSGQTWTKRPTRGRAVPPLCLKMADKYHQHLRGGIVGKLQKFGPFSNNLLWLFENGGNRPSTILWEFWWKTAEISAVFLQPQLVVWKRQKTNHQQFCGDFVGKRPKFRPFSNNWLSAIFQQPKMFRPFSN